MTRVYAPADLDLLADWARTGTVRGGPERVLAGSEDEDDEHAALATAATDSAGLAGPGGRRVVVVLETRAPDVDGDLPWSEVVAVHADLAAPADDAGPGGPGDPDDPDDPGELAWVATQEVGRLLDGSL